MADPNQREPRNLVEPYESDEPAAADGDQQQPSGRGPSARDLRDLTKRPKKDVEGVPKKGQEPQTAPSEPPAKPAEAPAKSLTQPREPGAFDQSQIRDPIGTPGGDRSPEPVDETGQEPQQESDDQNRDQPDRHDRGEGEPSQQDKPSKGKEGGAKEGGEGAKGAGKAPEGVTPSGGGLVGGAEKGLDMGKVGAGAGRAGAAAGEAATQGALRALPAMLMNPVGLAIFALVLLVILSVMGYLATVGIAGQKSGSGGSAQQTDQPGSGGTVDGNIQQLAQQILKLEGKSVSFLSSNPKGSLEAAAKGKCSPVPSTGDCVKLDKRLLEGLLATAEKRDFIINSLTTGDHSTCSNHYQGRAVDMGPVEDSLMDEFRKRGANELINEGDHIHAGWDGPTPNCE